MSDIMQDGARVSHRDFFPKESTHKDVDTGAWLHEEHKGIVEDYFNPVTNHDEDEDDKELVPEPDHEVHVIDLKEQMNKSDRTNFFLP